MQPTPLPSMPTLPWGPCDPMARRVVPPATLSTALSQAGGSTPLSRMSRVLPARCPGVGPGLPRKLRFGANPGRARRRLPLRTRLRPPGRAHTPISRGLQRPTSPRSQTAARRVATSSYTVLEFSPGCHTGYAHNWGRFAQCPTRRGPSGVLGLCILGAHSTKPGVAPGGLALVVEGPDWNPSWAGANESWVEGTTPDITLDPTAQPHPTCRVAFKLEPQEQVVEERRAPGQLCCIWGSRAPMGGFPMGDSLPQAKWKVPPTLARPSLFS